MTKNLLERANTAIEVEVAEADADVETILNLSTRLNNINLRKPKIIQKNKNGSKMTTQSQKPSLIKTSSVDITKTNSLKILTIPILEISKSLAMKPTKEAATNPADPTNLADPTLEVAVIPTKNVLSNTTSTLRMTITMRSQSLTKNRNDQL
jgi:predicted SPOUT superfamily RNA methylase MTH1